MEDSIRTVVDEESGWTMYLDDFFAKNNYNDDDETCSSLVSDATSLVLNKNSHNSNNVLHHNKSYSKLSFKKRKNKGIPNYSLVDDALEDTASSPVNSSKVYDLMKQYNKSSKHKENIALRLSQEKGIKSESITDEDGRSDDLGFIGRENESTELKKRGLCLVPLSMVVSYFG